MAVEINASFQGGSIQVRIAGKNAPQVLREYQQVIYQLFPPITTVLQEDKAKLAKK